MGKEEKAHISLTFQEKEVKAGDLSYFLYLLQVWSSITAEYLDKHPDKIERFRSALKRKDFNMIEVDISEIADRFRRAQRARYLRSSEYALVLSKISHNSPLDINIVAPNILGISISITIFVVSVILAIKLAGLELGRQEGRITIKVRFASLQEAIYGFEKMLRREPVPDSNVNREIPDEDHERPSGNGSRPGGI